MVDDLFDFRKGQAFGRFHCYTVNRFMVIAYSAYCLFFISFYFYFFVYCIVLYVRIFFFDATILVNKDVYYRHR